MPFWRRSSRLLLKYISHLRGKGKHIERTLGCTRKARDAASLAPREPAAVPPRPRRSRFVADSPLEGDGFEPSVPRCVNSGVAADPPRNNDDAIALRPRVAGSSFFWATQLMSYEREAMYALYDLCHEVDDIDDGDASRQPRRARPAGFQNAGISKCSRLASESVLALRPSWDWLRA